MSSTLYARKCLRWNAGPQCFSLLMKSPYSSSLNSELSSLLYIPGDIAHKVVSILKPAVSFAVQDDEIEIMRQNIQARCLKQNVDLMKLRNDFQFLQTLRLQLDTMKEKQAKFHVNKGEMEESKLQEIQSARKTLRKLAKTVSLLEESVVPQLLLLPNRLHKETPKSELIIHEFSKPPCFNFDVASHETIGYLTKTLVWNSFVGPDAYYFTGDLAYFEQIALDYFRTQFKANSFIALSNPDFTKSIVVEGCGFSFSDPMATFHLERGEDANVNIPVDLHLTGSASVMAFCAFHSKTSVKVANLPFKYYATGRRYNPVLKSGINKDGLFAVTQNIEIPFFIATQNESEAEKEYSAMLQILQSTFKKLKLHFRTIATPANNLSLSESKRSEIQMWSPARRAYFTVSHISLHDDFISRRLLMSYRKEQLQKNYLHVVSGTAISIPPFVACVIENLQTETQGFVLPLELQL